MPRRVLEGEIVSDKMDKTVTVLVERRYIHPVYKKYMKRSDKYAAHDETNAFRVGDKVQIEECRPISKRKSWRVITQAPTGREPKVLKAAPVEAAAPKKEKKEKAPKAAAAATAEKTEAKKPAAKKAPAKKKDESK
jgi:small subunit ribosomal protein S17